MADRETFHNNASLPRVLEAFDAVRREDQVQIERPVLELNEILTSPDFGFLVLGESKAEVIKRNDCGLAICQGPLGKPSRIAPDLPRKR